MRMTVCSNSDDRQPSAPPTLPRARSRRETGGVADVAEGPPPQQ